MEKCPVCGMSVDPRDAAATASVQGRTYYFCSAECKAEFEKNPERFVAQKARK